MVQKRLLALLSIFLTINFSGCSFLEPEIITVTNVIKPEIPIVEHPKKISVNDVHFYVVTAENIEDFKLKFLKKENDLVFVALSIKDYENLSLNLADIIRYIKQQKNIILYYEDSIISIKDDK